MKYEIEKVKAKVLAIGPVANIAKIKSVDDSIRANSKIRPVLDNRKIRAVDESIRTGSRIKPVTENTIRKALQ